MVLGLLLMIGCKETVPSTMDAQQIVDKSIEVSGGDLYTKSNISFNFRDREYHYERIDNKKILKRIFKKDTSTIIDIKEPSEFCRYINDDLVVVADSLANLYANSVNSVHYFAHLPYGLNAKAVHKELLGNVTIKNKDYYKLKVTFSEEGGGDDFDDVYIYWFNKETYKPDYLAYEFAVNGGGKRFREAYNERYVNGIRFVDYNNYKPKDKNTSIYEIDELFGRNELELLSKIELENVQVTQIN
ncbi:MAG: deoxyribose-phosphate aldolase [Flavobacteriaceae bacterium]|nr:MAG: deoxyribose-phosphate aldolase [Flavobacteriaceae bacterium]